MKKRKSFVILGINENLSLEPLLCEQNFDKNVLSPSLQEEEIFFRFKNQVEDVFKDENIEKSRIEDYLLKIESFLKIPFLIYFRNLTKESINCLFAETDSFVKYAADVHQSYASFLKFLEKATGGRIEIQNIDFRVVHHILPKFAEGTNEESNRVLLHQYEHALIHFFCFLLFKNSWDLNAFSSACLTEEQVKRRNKGNLETQQIARKKTVLNPEWQATFGRKGVYKSADLCRGKSNASALSRSATAKTG